MQQVNVNDSSPSLSNFLATRLPQFSSNSSRPDTPENGLFPEDDGGVCKEPSSALASRILRAQDNPSPPPISPSARITPTNSCRLIDISEPTTPCCPVAKLPDHALPLLLSPSLVPPIHNSPSHLGVTQPQGDLIIFDVSDEPITTSKPVSTPPNYSRSKPISSDFFGTSLTSTNDEAHQSADEHLTPNKDSPICYLDPKALEGSKLDEPLTPIRRSARSRKSATPRQAYPATVIGDIHPDSQSRPQSSEARTRVRRKSSKLPAAPDLMGEQSSEPVGMLQQGAEAQYKDPSSVDHRLGSLSPASSHVLNQLVTISRAEKPHSSRSPFPTAVTPMPFVDVPKKPNDVGSPRRLQLDASPSKPPPFDPPLTPARRIVFDGVSLSSSKGTLPSPFTSRTGIPRIPIFNIPTNDSPARRILKTTTGQLKFDASSLQSPARRMNIRSHSEEPFSTTIPPCSVKNKSSSVEPHTVTQSVTSSSLKSRDLPFPLIPESIPEEPIDGSRSSASLASNSISALKQRTSRIPRIGSKPYARPAPATRPVTNKFQGSVRGVEEPKPLVLVTSTQSVRGDTDFDRTSLNKTSVPRTANQMPIILKRKRSPEGPNKTSKTLPRSTHGTAAQHGPKSMNRALAKPPGTIKTDEARRTSSQPQRLPAAGIYPKPVPRQDRSTVPFFAQSDQEELVTKKQGDPIVVEASLTALVEEEQRQLPSNGFTAALNLSDAPTDEYQTAAYVDSDSAEARRSTRSSKKTTPKAVSRSLQSRKRVNNIPILDASVFSGMSAVALKALTNTNTLRNQEYIAAKIETEVIRKSGVRPTSPVKTQTVLQRTQEERSRERRDRAQRRAQRSGDAMREDRHARADQLSDSSSRAPSLDVDDHGGHRRGAGEDEDYQTPVRRITKMGAGDGSDTDDGGRRVKWDKGLYTEVSLDEVQVGARLRHRTEPLLKGCLAPTSKGVQLDTMGNLPNASMPVEDLVQESIVVKKFVYDDDDELEPPIAQGTRSRAKKSKS